MKTNRLLLWLSLILISSAMSAFGQAALTFSSTPQSIEPASVPNGETKADVVLSAPAGFSFFGAADFGTSSNVTVTLTGGSTLLFQAGGVGGTGGVVANTTVGAGNDNGTNAFSTASANGGVNQTTGNANFDTVLNNYAYDGNPQTITLNGLTSGTVYKVSFFTVDNRGPYGGRTVGYYDPSSSSASPTYAENSNQFVTATFTAAGSTEQIDLNGVSSVGSNNLNAVVVYAAVPLVSGFSNGSGWTLNSVNATGYNSKTAPGTGTSSLPILTATTAQLLPNQAFSGAASSIFCNTAQPIGAFTASFTFQATGGSSLGDGVAFVIQGGSPNAVGSLGGNGATTLPTSLAIALDFNAATPGNDFVMNGVSPVYSSTGSLSLANNQHPLAVTLSYNTITLYETITDTVTNASYSTSRNVDINAIVGGQIGNTGQPAATTGYIGFTAGSSANATAVTISNFTFAPATVPGIAGISKPIVPNGWGSCVAPNGYGGDYYQQTGTYGDEYFSPSQQAFFQASGQTLIRADLTWNNVEFSQGNYNWSYYDGFINNLQGTGITVMFILDYTNSIYPGNVYQQPALGGYANFAAAAATHYKGKNVIFEIWNEPNFAYGFTGSQYSTIAIAAEQAMRAAVPNVTIIGPAEGELDPVWREAMLSTGGGDSLNAYSFHPYAYPPESMLTSNGYLGGFPGVAADLVAYPASNGLPLPMMASESGTAGDTLQNQASWYTRIYLVDQLFGLALNTTYKYQDDAPRDNTPANNDYGLIYANNTPKPAYTAVKNLIGSLNGYEQIGSINTGNGNLYDSVYQKGTSLAEAIWSSNSPGDSALPYIHYITTGSAEYNQILNAVYANSQAVIAPPSFTTQFTVTAPNAVTNGVPLGTPFQVTVTALDEYNNPTNYNGTVHFTSTDPSAVLPADAQLTNGVGTFNVTFNTAAYEYVTATDTSTPSLTNAFSGTAATPSFSISTSATPLTVNQGTSGEDTFKVTFMGGLTQAVTLSASGMPTGVTATFSSPSVSQTTSCSVILTVSPTAPVGDDTIVVTATSGATSQSFTIPLTIGPGTTLATNSFLAVGQYIVSPSATCYLIMQSDGELVLYSGSGPANQGAKLWTSGATGSGGGFTTVMQTDGNLVTYSSTGSPIWSTGTYTGANYTLNALDSQVIEIRSGTSVIWQKPTTAASTLTLTPVLGSMTVDQGTSGINTLALTYSGSFSGSTALTVSGVPAGVTGTLSSASLSGSGNITLSLVVSPTAAMGTTTLTVRAVSGQTTRIAMIPLTIGPGSRLANSTYLSTGQYIASPSGNCYLTAQKDGNVVLYNGSSPTNGGSAIWASGSGGSGNNFYLYMQPDGNLTMNPGTGPAGNTGSKIWAAGTSTGFVGSTYTLNVLDTKVVQILYGSAVIWQEPANATPPPMLTNSLPSMDINEGTSAASTLTVAGFSGTVILSASSLPTGVTASFSSSTVNSSGNSLLTLAVASTAQPGTSSVTIKAVNGTISTSVTIPIVIGAGSTLANESFLAVGQYIVSPAGNCYLIQQANGNLVLYSGSGPAHQGTMLWQSNKTGTAGSYYTIMQADGNLVTYPGTGPTLSGTGAALWASGTYGGNASYMLTVTNTEVAQLVSGSNVILTEGTPVAVPAMPGWYLGLLAGLLFFVGVWTEIRKTFGYRGLAQGTATASYEGTR